MKRMLPALILPVSLALIPAVANSQTTVSGNEAATFEEIAPFATISGHGYNPEPPATLTGGYVLVDPSRSRKLSIEPKPIQRV